jgi:phosphinothricin acetyltransferase
VRRARPEDAARIAEIYNQGIEDRVATFETRPRDADEVAGWIAGSLPVVVADRDGDVVGFARVSPYSNRWVYGGIGEHGVYVARDARGGGIGRRLLEAVAAESARAGLYKLTARIFADNRASLAVHRAAGFREVGVQRRHARLDGEWKDVVLVERLLGEAADE